MSRQTEPCTAAAQLSVRQHGAAQLTHISHFRLQACTAKDVRRWRRSVGGCRGRAGRGAAGRGWEVGGDLGGGGGEQQHDGGGGQYPAIPVLVGY